MNVKVKENDYTCGTCKHYNHKEDNCWLARDMFFTAVEHCCIYWEEEEVELTEDEKREIAGDIEAHRRMVEGDEIN